MKEEMFRKYTKILNFGDAKLKDFLQGNIHVEEKIDGSQFRVFCYKKERIFGSKATNLNEVGYGMFTQGVEEVTEALEKIKFPKPTMIYGEYLTKLKHNCIIYDRIPKHKVIIFDIVIDGEYLSYKDKAKWCKENDFEVVPILWEGDGKDLSLELIQDLVKCKSKLGDTQIEGIVIKNYEKHHTIDYLLGKPMFAKFVREDFKERNTKEWKKNNKSNFLEALYKSYNTEARFEKALQHLKEKGELDGSPKDIGLLIKEVSLDLKTEEEDNIKTELFKYFWKTLSKVATKGLPQWYKNKLAEEEKDDK